MRVDVGERRCGRRVLDGREEVLIYLFWVDAKLLLEQSDKLVVCDGREGLGKRQIPHGICIIKSLHISSF